jgi:3'-phosphoadenosine 5'-phosphosulfate sulfotransferase (PAPS reductase)/FAD synthetase
VIDHTRKEHNIVSVSGGKDSTALLLLAIDRKVPNLQAVFADTGHEHQQTYDYVQYLNDTVFPIRTIRADFTKQVEAKRERLQSYLDGKTDRYSSSWTDEALRRVINVLQPTGNPFLDLCLWKGRFPSTKARFCSEELKRNPIVAMQEKILAIGENIMSWQGVRADESASRALLGEINLAQTHVSGAVMWNYRPILQWKAEDCFAMHRKYGVKPNPLYAQGMGRVGCMPCIHARKYELLQISKRFPEEIQRVYEMEKIVSSASKRNSSTFFAATDLGYSENDGRAFENFNVLRFVEWAKTSRGGRQIDFIQASPEFEACSSIYGLCE